MIDGVEATALTPGQRGIWALQQLRPESPFGIMEDLIEIEGPLDSAALEKALQRVVDDHPWLRCNFRQAGGPPEACFADWKEAALEKTLRAWSYGEGFLEKACENELAYRFDLGQGDLFRFHLVALGPDRHALFVNMHHIISDGWSMQVFWRDLSRHYGEAIEGGLAAGSSPRAAGSAAGGTPAPGGKEDGNERYWREALEGARPFLDLPYRMTGSLKANRRADHPN